MYYYGVQVLRTHSGSRTCTWYQVVPTEYPIYYTFGPCLEITGRGQVSRGTQSLARRVLGGTGFRMQEAERLAAELAVEEQRVQKLRQMVTETQQKVRTSV